MTKPFPWAEAMQFGFGVLHLSSEAFWRMTPRELAQAVTALRGQAAAPIARENFDALMRRFPDHQYTVMRGLDPRIHPSSQEFFQEDGLPGQARQRRKETKEAGDG